MKCLLVCHSDATCASPPSRGAWIEMCRHFLRLPLCKSPPSRGAWIEIFPSHAAFWKLSNVAPLAGGVD